MIAAWMLYCVTLATLVAGAAALTERLVDRAGGVTRRVWAWGMVAAVVAPMVGVLVRDGAPVDRLGVRTASDPVAAAVQRGVDTLASVDDLLLFAWLLATGVGVAWVVSAVSRTRRRRRAWASTTVDGVRVLVSRGVGPAVIGLLRGTIVLPAWALEASPDERTMMLRHEQEHLRAHDPLLATLGLVLVMAMPWNPALWYMAHRLRLAIEVDCDRRVVGGGGVDVRAYGALLLSVGRRRSRLPLAAAAFSRPRSALEHRIDRMTLSRGNASRWRSLLLGFAALAILVGAWVLPQPVRAADVDGALFQCPGAEPSPPMMRWS